MAGKPVSAGTAYWYDLFQPALGPGAVRAGAHLCLVLSNADVNSAMASVVMAPGARPENKRVANDVYRVRVLPEDYMPAPGNPVLDRPRTFGMENLASVPQFKLGSAAGVVDLSKFSNQSPDSYRSFATALTVQFQLPGYVDVLAAAGKRGAAFYPPRTLARGAVVRCVLDGHRRLGVIVSNDFANGWATSPSVQVLLLGNPRAGWSVPLECVARLHLTPNLRPLLKDSAEGANCVLQQVSEATDLDRQRLDEVILSMFCPLIGKPCL